MSLSLYFKFILAYLAFGIAGFIAIATLSSKLTHNYLISSRSGILYDEANLIASTYSNVYEGSDLDLNQAYPQLKAVATFLDSYIWIMSKDGKVIVDSANNKTNSTIEGFNPLATGNKSYMTGSYFGSFPFDVLSVSAPITGNYKTYGYIVIHLPMTKVVESQNKILNIVYITFFIVFLLSTLILIVFHKIVYTPLREITTAAKRYAQGDLSFKANVTTNDEMGYLAGTLNFMATELSQTEEYQRNFITNISHDFRSPLTSIKGYLSAILDGTITPDMQKKYIQRVIDESERLSKLTDNILTLNDLDTKGRLFRTNFDIHRVIKDTAKSFELQCNAKNVLINLIFTEESQNVYADMTKIQQVLYNLIDNAIKFSNTDSAITISTTQKKGKIFISVKDSGIGIDKKDIAKVFDRFYKSDYSRGKDKKGTGLGLSIVKDIVQAHGEYIDVISTKDVGTEFVFSIPLAQ